MIYKHYPKYGNIKRKNYIKNKKIKTDFGDNFYDNSITSQECPLQYFNNPHRLYDNKYDTFYVPYLGNDKENYRGLDNVYF